ncbi:MAG TPA: lanthionine synthetase LanC family protein [Bryobacteraceae bacterium]|nr:lanthionine synthetase LanC family protein [Bryobacteraceae bacterium]
MAMPFSDPMILPADMLLIPVKDLPESVRQQIQADEGDYALTRPQSRTPSRVVDADSAELLRQFRKPTTIVQAVIRYSRETNSDPERTLEEAYPMLERLARAHLLVPSDSEEARRIEPLLQPAARIAGLEVVRPVQALEDTELYEVRTAEGHPAALKILRPTAGKEVARLFDREAAILERLNGDVSPKLLGNGTADGRRYLLLEWCSGVDCSTLAADWRQTGGAEGRRSIVNLCAAILDAYARLHARNVIHSDVHPRNVLVNSDLQVKLIDFGLARIAGIENEFRSAPRGGIGFFFEPEYAKAAGSKKRPPASSALGEQYALGALFYFLATGHHYLDFSAEKHEMFRQIAEDAPLEFAHWGVEAWPELEEVLRRALQKHSSERFRSVTDFAEALKSCAVVEDQRPIPSRIAAEPSAYPDAQEILGRMLARLDARAPLFASGLAAAPKVSVTYGMAGMAYGLYRIACAREDAELLALADLWATRAARQSNASDAFYSTDIEITPEIVGRVSPYHTESGVHLVQALIGVGMGDMASQQSALDQFVVAVQAAPCHSLDVTLGQSGLLLGSSILLDSVSDNPYIQSEALTTFGNQCLDSLWKKLQGFGPIRECREIAYSGAAHGWAGILYATLNWCRASKAALPASTEDRLDQLARFADRSGGRARWRFMIRKHSLQPGAEYMSGWCNGSSGFVFLWTLAHQMLGKAEYGTLAEQAGLDAWESDGQIGNLCCGFAGQAYALLNLYKHTGDKAWLHGAQAQAQRAARSIQAMPSSGDYQELAMRAESLYKGELGVAVLAAELEKPESAAMPLFERENVEERG